MDREASLRALAAERMVANGYRMRVRVTVVGRGEPRRMQHLFAPKAKESLCAGFRASETVAQALSRTMKMCPACMEAAPFQEALATVTHMALVDPNALLPAKGFSLPSTKPRTFFKQEGLPEEFLPEGSGARTSWYVEPEVTSG